jgi:hypothetical protein
MSNWSPDYTPPAQTVVPAPTPAPNTTKYIPPATSALATRQIFGVHGPYDDPPATTKYFFADGTSTTLIKEPF